MTSPKPENGEQPDSDLRELTFKKLQYGKLAENVVLRYQNGLFLPEPTMSSLNKAAREQRADEIFLALLGKYDSAGRYVSDKATANNYAPKAFATEKEAKEFRLTKDELAAAQRRLLAACSLILDRGCGKAGQSLAIAVDLKKRISELSHEELLQLREKYVAAVGPEPMRLIEHSENQSE